MTQNTLCSLINIEKRYPLGELEVRALSEINLTFQNAEFTVLSGPSGSGKSTLLNLIGLLDRPSSGELILDGLNSCTLSEQQLGKIRAANIGFIFQSFHLIPVLSAFENVELAPYMASVHHAHAAYGHH